MLQLLSKQEDLKSSLSNTDKLNRPSLNMSSHASSLRRIHGNLRDSFCLLSFSSTLRLAVDNMPYAFFYHRLDCFTYSKTACLYYFSSLIALL